MPGGEQDPAGLKRERPIWAQSVGLNVTDRFGYVSPKARAIAKQYKDGLWMVRQINSAEPAEYVRWLNAGTYSDGGPAWSGMHAALYTLDVAVAIKLAFEDTPGVEIIRLL